MVGNNVNLFVAGLQGTNPDHTGHHNIESLWQLDNLDSEEPHNHK